MPSPRYTDRLPPARLCAGCRATHRPGVPCPRPDFWLIAGTPLWPGAERAVERA